MSASAERSRASGRGLTLLEVMVAIGILAMVVYGVRYIGHRLGAQLGLSS